MECQNLYVDLFKDAVHDLSVFNADAFNMATPNRADVDYYSWAFAQTGRRDVDVAEIAGKRNIRN